MGERPGSEASLQASLSLSVHKHGKEYTANSYSSGLEGSSLASSTSPLTKGGMTETWDKV